MTFSQGCQQALRLLLRESREREVRILWLALILAVTAVTAVGFFTSRVDLALTQEANQLLGGDLLVVSDHPILVAWGQEARRRGLQTAETRTFPSMVMANGRAQLADVKAVSGTYPLRGRLVVVKEKGEGESAASALLPGEVWLDERLAASLAVSEGDRLQLGQATFTVAGRLTHEPDRAVNFLGVAPRLMLRIEDVAATGLEQPGSRINERLLLAGERAQLEAFQTGLQPRLERGQRLEDPGSLRPETRSALDQARRFLGLSSGLTVILAAVAVALAARHYWRRHVPVAALLRTLGMTRRQLLGLHGLQFLFLSSAATVLGGFAGFVTHHALIFWLGTLIGMPLPAPSFSPLLQAWLMVLVLLLTFLMPYLWRLSLVPPLRVLRRDLPGSKQTRWQSAGLYGLAWVGLSALLVWLAGNVRLGMGLALGFTVALMVFVAIVAALLRLISVWRPAGAGGLGWRLGLSHLQRHLGAVTVQTVALALGLLALLLLTVTRTDLLAAWERQLPLDAPNHFVINLQAGQRAAFSAWLATQGIKPDAAPLAPMVRGRLLEVSGKTVSAASYPEDERAQRLVEREFNLSWRNDFPPANTLETGAWFPAGSEGKGLASVEAGLAKTLGIQLGDTLRFSVAGQSIEVTVSSLRKVAWDSMRPNFFVLTPSGVLPPEEASYITSFYLPPGHAGFAPALSQHFPNLTLIDVSVLLDQMKRVMTQLSLAVQFIFIFSILAGLLVLLASLLGSLDERRQSVAVMRALGATLPPLRQALWLELAVSGALAGGLAALGAALAGHLLATQVFNVPMQLSLVWIPWVALLGASLSLGIGWLGIRDIFRVPALQALRQSD